MIIYSVLTKDKKKITSKINILLGQFSYIYFKFNIEWGSSIGNKNSGPSKLESSRINHHYPNTPSSGASGRPMKQPPTPSTTRTCCMGTAETTTPKHSASVIISSHKIVSLFECHNETCNMWTHLIPFVGALFSCLYVFIFE